MFLKTGLILALLALTRSEKLTLADIDDSMTIEDEILVRSPDEIYRLPTTVKPISYDIFIDFYFAEKTDNPFSYNGRENIIIQAQQSDVFQIVLHANVDKINNVTVETEDGATLDLGSPSYLLEPQYHFLKINLQQALAMNTNYTLNIDYSSTMNEGPMKRGIWRGWYKDNNGVERIYTTTHFQPYNARQAFPCWDEPFFKSVFTVHLSAPASYIKMFSNSEVASIENDANAGRLTTNFYPTPRMSSYLVTFLVSETFQVIAEDTSFKPPIRIIGRSNTAGLADHALELTVKMTQFFDEYFEIPYSTLHPHLTNDHISSPDWASAATENWGMVSYRELYMIIDPKETIMSTEQYASTLVSHELAHKWMGNLITCFWWSNTWINEGFASYFGYIAAHGMFPKYELHEHFNSRYLQASLSFDSGTSTVPLNHDVNTPAQVTGHFGTISYSKGAAFLRMISDMITPETFRKACKFFLIDNAFEPTDQHDLYEAFSKAIQEDRTLSQYQHFNFTEFYRIWVNEAGYPILNVTVNHSTGEMELSQERFFISATAASTGQIYPIPITYSTKSKPSFDELKPSYMMSGDRAVLNKDVGEEWVIFNNQQHGLYRVNYDEKTWNLIADALLKTPDDIHHLNRAQVVDDVFALMRSEKMTYDYGFKILRFLEKETNYHVWNPAISGYTWLRNRFRHLPETQATFDAHVLGYMEHVINYLGYEPKANESTTTSVTRQEVLHFACLLGHEGCVKESLNRFIALKNGNWIDPRIRRNVYVVGIREGGAEDFNFLLNRFQTSNYANDQLEMLRGLGATRDPQLLTRYLELTLTKEVRSHDKVNAYNYALLGNKDNSKTVLEFVKNNIDTLRKVYVEDSPANPVHTALSNLASYLEEGGLQEYEAWLRSTQTNSLQFNRAISAINSARNTMAWGTANADMILKATRSSASVLLISTTLVLAMLFITIRI
ncbi:membrane alanyl aminopeptidase-like [Pieris napi]|uniref:membrane alanyl aminopeptidase-like n=1 Tax=Pieris napi TaxID=78633 RepID=UPI001FB99A69|nr:membrane alanyl aminopeptidase-like [Pieris napi]